MVVRVVVEFYMRFTCACACNSTRIPVLDFLLQVATSIHVWRLLCLLELTWILVSVSDPCNFGFSLGASSICYNTTKTYYIRLIGGSTDVGSNIIPANASMTASAYFPQREGQLKLPPLPPSSSDGDLGYLSNNSDGGVGTCQGQGNLHAKYGIHHNDHRMSEQAV